MKVSLPSELRTAHNLSQIILIFNYLSLNIACTIIQIAKILTTLGTSINLSPLGMVSVCPGGQVLLTCERTSGVILYWNVSASHLAGTTTERIVLSRGVLLSPQFRKDFTGFNITRTSESPLISQLLISNVTTKINGSTIYCSEHGNENNAPMTVINVINKGMIALRYIYYTFISEHAVNMVISLLIIDEANLQSSDRSLNVTLVNQVLRHRDTTVTLQWPI